MKKRTYRWRRANNVQPGSKHPLRLQLHLHRLHIVSIKLTGTEILRRGLQDGDVQGVVHNYKHAK